MSLTQQIMRNFNTVQTHACLVDSCVPCLLVTGQMVSHNLYKSVRKPSDTACLVGIQLVNLGIFFLVFNYIKGHWITTLRLFALSFMSLHGFNLAKHYQMTAYFLFFIRVIVLPYFLKCVSQRVVSSNFLKFMCRSVCVVSYASAT